ncbi:hypothetical protein [Candidatus Nanohalococcus occultus]|uniref:Uncharacterized protein n=1 Tax=Candidatus Nanohalococcus occultus TaxID=2978047 RepID=A0ABY8CGW9_9ARCH|nr:hypothetical protein SVXNc_0247 [Candidatus Nanohaloarchaeota archaeon SVXNc]
MKKLLGVLAAIFLVSQASAYIGIMPSQQNLGTVERGETYELNLYVTSDTSEPITVQPGASRLPRNILEGLDNVDYFSMDEYSAEPVESWIDFSQEEYVLRPEGFEQRVAGREVNANISYELDVPRNAESGYHAAQIQLNPQFETGEGTSVRTVGLSSYSVFFRVPGEVDRRLEVTDVEALRSGEDAALIRADVTNTGSVTTYLESGDVEVQGTGLEDSFNMGGMYIEPGSTEQVETTWSLFQNNIEAGNYRIQGSLSYVTGQAFLQETVSITDFIQIQPSDQQISTGGVLPEGQGDSSIPVFLIVMFLVTTGAIMYAFEIDPLLIIMAMGVFGVSMFIYFSSLPVYGIAIVLLAAAGMFYYGWL